MSVRAIRGATQTEQDTREDILAAVEELVGAVLSRNEIGHDDLISIMFTSTPDLRSEFPAYAARRLGLGLVPLLGAVEVDVPGALPRIIRMLAHVESDRPRSDMRHVYLRGAAALRTDLPH